MISCPTPISCLRYELSGINPESTAELTIILTNKPGEPPPYPATVHKQHCLFVLRPAGWQQHCQWHCPTCHLIWPQNLQLLSEIAFRSDHDYHMTNRGSNLDKLDLCSSTAVQHAGTYIIPVFVPKFSPFWGFIFSPFFCPPVGVESVSERANPTLLFKTTFRIHFLPPFFIHFLLPFFVPFLPPFFIPILPPFFIPFLPRFSYHFYPRFSHHSYPFFFITSPDSSSNG